MPCISSARQPFVQRAANYRGETGGVNTFLHSHEKTRKRALIREEENHAPLCDTAARKAFIRAFPPP